jgi:hypothetical protein
MASLGYRTFKQMQDEVVRNVQDSSTAGLAKIKDCIRRAYDTVCAEHEWAELQSQDTPQLRKRDEADIATIEASEARFPLPAESYKILDISLISPCAVSLERVSPSELAQLAGTKFGTAGGIPRYYALVGRTAQYRSMGGDSILTVKSDNTNANATVRLVYRTSTGLTGNTVDEMVTGADFTAGIATAVAVNGNWGLDSVYVPPSWVGNLTVENATAVEIAHIEGTQGGGTASDEWNYFSRQLARCWPIPTADYSGVITFQRKPRELIDDLDVPEIPISTFLTAKATAQFLRQARRPDEAREFDRDAGISLKSVASSGPQAHARIRPKGSMLSGTGLGHRISRGYYGGNW